MCNLTSMNKIRFLNACMAIAFSLCMFPMETEAQRTEKTINVAWDFKKEGETTWQAINLPHTFNLDAYSKRIYYQGKGVYKKRLSIKDLDMNKCYYLKFEAASKAADVTVNGKHLATHVGGYSSFIVDITDIVKSENEIEVVVDNARKDIAPISADFTFWGGIYRDVWLISTPKQHFNMSNYGSKGVFVSTPIVNEKEGVIQVKAELVNAAAGKSRLKIRNTVYDYNGAQIQKEEKSLTMKPGEYRVWEYQSKVIQTPALWSPESPSLYKVVTAIVDARTGNVLDEISNKVGFRWFAFDGNKGLSLNGKPYKLRGVNRHQDQKPVGVAIDNEVNRRDIQLMKEIGCNFLRIAHYPQDDALLDACDELGLLAWEEIPIVNMVPDTPGFEDNCETNMVEMIRQHYNHPCVIAWGYMNEILLVTPPPGRPEWPSAKERILRLANRLEKRLKEEDSTRVSVMAFNMTDLYNEIGLNLVDVSGWNLYQGWYVDTLPYFNKWCEDQHLRYPQRPMIISEWGAGSDKRIHSYNGKAFDFSMEYHQTYTEHYLSYIEEKEWIAGCAYWNFIDFNVAARQESMPRVNNKGIFYNDRTPKDIAYYFKAMWRKDIPVIHIASRDWDVRTGAADAKQHIKVYTNLEEIELFVDGKSQGKRKADNCHAIFQVVLPVGTSSLHAVGYKNGKKAEDMTMITYRSLPDLSAGEELAINVGSNCHFISDVSHLNWLPDQPYSKGSWGYVNGQAKSTTSEIFNTVDGPIYQTWLENITEYKIDAPVGTYEVELLLADVSRPSRQLANLLGKGDEKTSFDGTNRFDITICGVQVEKDFAPADNHRYLHACRLRYIVNNMDGCISIRFNELQGKSILSGIKIKKM